MDLVDVSRFYGDSRPDLLAYARFLAGNFPDAEDAVQEAVRESWRLYHCDGALCPPGREPVPWMKVIIRNYLRTQHRRRRRAERRAPDLYNPVPGPGADDVLDQMIAAEAVRFIESLPAHAREIARLNLVEGLSTGEIASRLGIAQSTVRSAMLRVRRRLRASLGLRDDGPDGGPGQWQEVPCRDRPTYCSTAPRAGRS